MVGGDLSFVLVVVALVVVCSVCALHVLNYIVHFLVLFGCSISLPLPSLTDPSGTPMRYSMRTVLHSVSLIASCIYSFVCWLCVGCVVECVLI